MRAIDVDEVMAAAREVTGTAARPLLAVEPPR
jgi:hypothetical protein